MSPYAPQNFPFLSPYLSQEANRSVASVPLTESLSSGYATDRPAAPSYGMITELPLPVPTAESFSQVRVCGEAFHSHIKPVQISEINTLEKLLKLCFYYLLYISLSSRTGRITL